MVERIIVGPLETNCYLYSNGKKECFIIDPGGNAEHIVTNINLLKMVPAAILLTHGHFDHTAAIGQLKEIYQKEGIPLPIAIHKADKKYLGRQSQNSNLATLSYLGFQEQESLAGFFSRLPEPDLLLKEGDSVMSSGLTVIETPGHTKGSVCLFSEKDNLLFSGDTIFFQGVGRTDLPGGSEQSLLRSIRKKLLILPPETRVFPGHGVSTTIEREIRGNPFIR